MGEIQESTNVSKIAHELRKTTVDEVMLGSEVSRMTREYFGTLAAKIVQRESRREWDACVSQRSVYFVQASSGPIKIGSSADVPRRVAVMQTDNHEELRLIGVMPGGENAELRFHAVFQAYRIRGEWFHPDADLLAFIAEHAALPNVPENDD